MVALENISSETTVDFTHLLDYVHNSTQVNEHLLIILTNQTTWPSPIFRNTCPHPANFLTCSQLCFRYFWPSSLAGWQGSSTLLAHKKPKDWICLWESSPCLFSSLCHWLGLTLAMWIGASFLPSLFPRLSSLFLLDWFSLWSTVPKMFQEQQ